MITGTTRPTTGGVRMHGRVAALLELGMGFHPDFTGRQNVVMAGQLLGLGRTRSSADAGRSRPSPRSATTSTSRCACTPAACRCALAFSVATAVRPDVLIVDEALSVGDAYFQHKSFDRIRSFREQGTTCCWSRTTSRDPVDLRRGHPAERRPAGMQGEPEAVMDYYNALIAEKENSTVRQELTTGRAPDRIGHRRGDA